MPLPVPLRHRRHVVRLSRRRVRWCVPTFAVRLPSRHAFPPCRKAARPAATTPESRQRRAGSIPAPVRRKNAKINSLGACWFFSFLVNQYPVATVGSSCCHYRHKHEQNEALSAKLFGNTTADLHDVKKTGRRYEIGGR